MGVFSDLKISHRLIILILTIQAMILAIVWILDNNSRELIDSTDWIIHTEKALKNISGIEKTIVDLETGQRGFLITGKESYLEPFMNGKEVIYKDLEAFKALTSDNPKQTKEVDLLRPILEQKIAELEQTIQLRREVGFEEAKEIVVTDLGKNLMDEIMLHTEHMRQEELDLLAVRSLVPQEAKQNTTKVLLIVLLLNVALVIPLFYNFIGSINKPIKKILFGIKEIAKGNINYRLKTSAKDEIGQLANAFDHMLDELELSNQANHRLTKEIALRMQISQELSERNEELNKANIQLTAHDKALTISNKELEQFAYVSSHYLQEPLKTIQMFTDLLSKTGVYTEDSSVKQYVDIIDRTSVGMSEKVVDLLNYSRLGNNRELSTIDMNKLLEGVLNNLQKSIKETKAVIKVGELPSVQGNKTELSLIFQNLISNALKFKNQEITPKISVDGKSNKDGWCFAVSDNGIGIAQEHLNQIFQIFKRLHLDEDYEGTGVGLAQCKKIVQLHGGEIYCESEKGKGSQFTFTLPK